MDGKVPLGVARTVSVRVPVPRWVSPVGMVIAAGTRRSRIEPHGFGERSHGGQTVVFGLGSMLHAHGSRIVSGSDARADLGKPLGEDLRKPVPQFLEARVGDHQTAVRDGELHGRIPGPGQGFPGLAPEDPSHFVLVGSAREHGFHRVAGWRIGGHQLRGQ